MHTLDATRVVRSVTEKTLSVRNPAGRNSSILRANGFITKEYLQAVKDEAILKGDRQFQKHNAVLKPSSF